MRLEEFNPQNLAHAAWAFATLRLRQAELLLGFMLFGLETQLFFL